MSTHLLRPRTVLVLVSLALASCHDSGDYSPTAPPSQEALTLSSANGQTSLPADGISRLRLVANIPTDADLDKRTVVFATSAGTLVGGTAGASGSQEVNADITGTAIIELQSSLQVGEAAVTATIKNVAGLTRRLVVRFVSANPNDVIRFVAAPSTAPADGATLSGFRVEVSPSLPLGTTVTFSAVLGKFAPEGSSSISRTVDGSFRVTADLQSPSTLGSDRIRATAGGVTTEASIDYRRALPQRITVATNGIFQLAPSITSGLTVTANLARDIGMVTAGTVATFRATTSTGTTLGFFRDVSTTDASGRATATFLAGTTDYRGPLTITVGAEGSSVTGSTQIEIVDPP